MISDAVSPHQGRLTIEPASWRDLQEVRRLEQICFPRDAWPLLELLGALALPQMIRLKAMIEENLVGFVAVDIRARKGMAWIATIGVLPEYRRHGVASMLLQAAEARLEVPRVRLSVRASNEAALGLYRQFGYDQIGRWPAYYQGGEDAIVMEKRIE